MDPSVKAAWISSAVAVAVAVIGVIATGVAQSRGSKTAHANALALFKRQAEDHAKIRSEEASERKRNAFLADRRAVYVRFLAAMKDLQEHTTKYDKMLERNAALVAEPSSTPERDAERLAEMNSALSEIRAVADTQMATDAGVVSILEEILLLAPGEVSDAAVAWFNAKRDPGAGPFALFLNTARLDVGAQPLGTASLEAALKVHDE